MSARTPDATITHKLTAMTKLHQRLYTSGDIIQKIAEFQSQYGLDLLIQGVSALQPKIACMIRDLLVAQVERLTLCDIDQIMFGHISVLEDGTAGSFFSGLTFDLASMEIILAGMANVGESAAISHVASLDDSVTPGIPR